MFEKLLEKLEDSVGERGSSELLLRAGQGTLSIGEKTETGGASVSLRTPPLHLEKSAAHDLTRLAVLGFELEVDGSLRDVLKMLRGMRFLGSFRGEDPTEAQRHLGQRQQRCTNRRRWR